MNPQRRRIIASGPARGKHRALRLDCGHSVIRRVGKRTPYAMCGLCPLIPSAREAGS